MSNNVISFPAQEPVGGRSGLNYEAEHQERGRRAKKLIARTRHNLTWPERTSIARRLHEEILKAGIQPGDLAAAANLSYGTKELNKLRLKPGKDPKKAQLMAAPGRYLNVIKALAKLTRQNVDLVVDRVTIGTQVHPTRAERLDDVERTLRALELLAYRVDKQLGLFDQFQRTLSRKLELQARGDLSDWPFYELEGDEFTPPEPLLSDLRLSKKALKELGLAKLVPEKTRLRDVDTSNFHEEDCRYIQLLLDNYEESKGWANQYRIGHLAFWNTYLDDYAECLQIEALAFLPHVYLGILGDWNAWGIKDDSKAIYKARESLREECNRIPSVSLSSQDGKTPVLSIGELDYAVEHAWVVLYPDRNLTTISPVLVRMVDDIGSIVEPLTVGKLVELQDVELIGEKPTTAYEKLSAMTGERSTDTTEFELVEEWIRTGQHFKKNPYLRDLLLADQKRAVRDTLFEEEPSS